MNISINSVGSICRKNTFFRNFNKQNSNNSVMSFAADAKNIKKSCGNQISFSALNLKNSDAIKLVLK